MKNQYFMCHHQNCQTCDCTKQENFMALYWKSVVEKLYFFIVFNGQKKQ